MATKILCNNFRQCRKSAENKAKKIVYAFLTFPFLSRITSPVCCVYYGNVKVQMYLQKNKM